MYCIDFKYFVGSYVLVFWEITSWKELQIWFDIYEKDKRKKIEHMKRFRWFAEKFYIYL